MTKRATSIATLLLTMATLACGGGATDNAATEPTITEIDGVRLVENHAPQWPEGAAWRISAEPTLTLGVDAGEPSEMFMYPDPVRLVDGTFVVADRGSEELRAFDADGTHLWTAGGKGQGPGEFEGLGWVIPLPDGGIAATDFNKPRMTVLGPAGELVRTFEPVSHDNPRFFQRPSIENAFADGSLLAQVGPRFDRETGGYVGVEQMDRGWMPTGVFRYSAEGDEVELVAEVDYWEIGRTEATPVPFQARSWLLPHAAGFYHLNGRRPQVDSYGIDGAPRARFGLPRDPTPVTADDREGWLQKSIANAAEAGYEIPAERRAAMVFPETMPLWRNAMVDPDGRVWAERYLGLQHSNPMYYGFDDNSDPFFPVTDSIWDVFEPDGIWLGSVEMNPALTVEQIGDTWVLMSGEDDDGVARIYLYELIKG